MDVRLTQNVKLDEVPAKIAENLQQLCEADVTRLIQICAELLLVSKDNAEIVENLIDQVRDKLANLDRSLSDSQMILKGYNLAIKQKDDTEPKEESDAD